MPEIWTVSFDHWTLPIQVEHLQNGMVQVALPPIALLEKQKQAIAYWAVKLAFSEQPEGWYLELRMLRTYATPAPAGVDPEDLVRWCPPRHKEESRIEFKDMEGFFETVAGTGWAKTPKAAELLFSAFCKHMLYWLTARRQCVDLGFCVLTPLPYRANWKEILLSWQLKAKPGATRAKGLRKEFDPSLLMCNDLLGARKKTTFSKKGGIVWTLEVTPSVWWHRATADIEGMRLSTVATNQSSRMYWLEVGRKMEESRERAQAAYFSYLTAIALPTVQMVENLRTFNRVPDPQQSKTYFKHFALPTCLHYQVYLSAKGLNEHLGVTVDFGQTPSDVWPMFAIQPGSEDVRDAGGTGQPGEPDRVPVPDGVESDAIGG